MMKLLKFLFTLSFVSLFSLSYAQSVKDVKFVDLGLSVRWATCNVGADTPEEYGDYFAWGEIVKKNEYTVANSKTYKVDNLNSIGGNPKYDVATLIYGNGYRLPKISEFQELKECCIWMWITINGINGYKIVGPNGNSIFLPAAGYCEEDDCDGINEYGSYWTSSPNKGYTDESCGFSFDCYEYEEDWYERYSGASIRPVCDK